MSPSQNYYAILQVEASADLETIKRAYREKIRRYHPDQFAAELAQLQRSGNVLAARKLEAEIARAQQVTQRINEAYAVLSDTIDRAAYDQRLADERQRQYYDEIRRQRMQHWEEGRRTVKSRPHHQNPNLRQQAQGEGVPWILLLGLIALMIFVSALFSNVINSIRTPFTTYIPRNPTSEGSILAIELQATTNAEQATYIARSTIVFQPTATPRSASQNELLGDQFMNLGQAQRAIQAYNDAIAADADNATLYLKRAMAYTALYDEDNPDALQRAVADYAQALAIDAHLADAYLGRGMLYYDLWVAGADYAEEARHDLEQYLALYPDADILAIQVILDQLP